MAGLYERQVNQVLQARLLEPRRFIQVLFGPRQVGKTTALVSAQSSFSFREAQAHPEYWGRLVESAVGAYLLNLAAERKFELSYWREGDREVDFIIRSARTLSAIEIKSTRRKGNIAGMASFAQAFHPDHTLLAGGDGIPIDEFLQWEPEQ
jgi:uncharacterized protein